MSNLNVNGTIKSVGGGSTLVDIGIEEIGNDFIKWKNGLQVCWGVYSGSTGDKTVTLPSPFANTNYVVAWGSESDDGQTVSTRMISARNRTTSTFVNRFVTGCPMMYIAIGHWQ